MAWQGVEIEIQVPCAEGQTHPVRLRFTGWGAFEVAYNPCEELLGPVFARMAACTHYLHEKFPEAFRNDTALKRRLVEAFGAAGAPAVPALIQALGDRRENVRRAAAEALGAIGDPQAIPALIQAVGDSHSAVRRAAAEALVKIGTPAVPALIQALGDSDRDVRRAAAEALGAIGDPQAVPPLIQALGDSDSAVRRAAAEALGAIGDPQAVPPLIQALGDRRVLFAVRQRKRWANSATPKPCPRSACGRTQANTPCDSGGAGQTRRPPSRARAHPSAGG